MKNLLLPALLFVVTPALAQDLPQPSSHGEVEQIVGLTKVEVEYSRPSVKGRTIFGGLVPFDQVWRTGANKATQFETDGVIEIEGQKLEAGKYSLFTIPGEGAWEVIINKNTELWGEGDRKPEEDVLKVKVKAEPTEFTETFTIGFGNVSGDDAVLELRWEKTKVSLNIHADSQDKAMENIKIAIEDPAADYRTYASSARYLVDHKLMPKEALAYAEKSVGLEKKYWNTHTLALAYAENGDVSNAMETAKMSSVLAKEAKSEAYVALNDALIKSLQGKTETKSKLDATGK